MIGEGEAYIFDCPFSTLCRQVVTDSDGRVAVFDLADATSQVAIAEQTGDNVISVERVVLVPLEDWDPALIQPASQCVVGPASKDCLTPRLPYPQLPDNSVERQPQQILDGYQARNLPRTTANPELKLVFINRVSFVKHSVKINFDF